MDTATLLKADWNILKGKLNQKWASLTDDDLLHIEGKSDEVIGRIQKRTGESREAILLEIQHASHGGE